MSEPQAPPHDSRELLAAIPAEILEHDCGCGNAWRWAREGETAVDLGCGSGKTCFLLSRIIGRSGRVIGVDASPAMLGVARRHEKAVARAVGWSNVRFVESRIEDLGRTESARPLVADACADLVVLDCVLTLVQERDRGAILHEALRVVRPGGQLFVADILARDLERIPESMTASGFERPEVVERSEDARRVVSGVPRFATTMRTRRLV